MKGLLKATALVAVLMVSGGTLSAIAAPAAPGDFASRAADMLKAALPDYDVTIVDPLTLKIGPHGKPSEQLNLDRIAAFCNANAARCDEVLSSYVQRVAQMTRDMNTPVTPAMLRAVVRPAAFLAEAMKETGNSSKTAPVAAPYAGNLAIVCEFDFPTATRIVTTQNLQSLGMTADETLTRCKENTHAALPPLAGLVRKLDGRVFGELNGDAGYTSSRFLFHDDWAPVAAALDGHLIVAIPSDDLIFYGKEEDAAAVDGPRPAGR